MDKQQGRRRRARRSIMSIEGRDKLFAGRHSQSVQTQSSTEQFQRGVYHDKRVNQGDYHMAKKRKKKKIQTYDHSPPPYLPQEVVLENILTRLPFRTLIKLGCVCKLWYNSIHHDPHFASSHFLQSQKHPRLIFNILNVKCLHQKLFTHQISWVTDKIENDGIKRLVLENPIKYVATYKMKLVGYCNGLGCLINYKIGRFPGDINIFNPTLWEIMILRPMTYGHTIYCGFGFDSLTNEYKVVRILYTEQEEFKCMVFTLGTNSWRETTSFLPNPHEILSTTLQPYPKSAIFCGGALFWRLTEEPKDMLLSFDLHDEKFQVIQLPADCVSPTTERRNFVHLLESRGSLCIARIEEVLARRRTSEDQNSSSCRFKVHLHFLKDYKVKQVWIKESFHLRPSHLSPCCYNISSIRLVGYSGRVLLYWFDNLSVKFYDLHMRYLKVVKVAQKHPIFTENTKPLKDKDYHLNSDIENVISLKTFLPGEAHKLDESDALHDLLSDGRPFRGFLKVCGDSDTGKQRERFIF